MTRSEFIAATALILFGVFVLGWIASWVVHRIARPRADMTDMDRMAQQLHDAEEERDAAVALLRAREAALAAQLSDAQAEQVAAIEALRDSRSEIEELRDYIDQRLGRQ